MALNMAQNALVFRCALAVKAAGHAMLNRLPRCIFLPVLYPLRSPQFAAWSSAAPLAGVQGGWHPPCSGCVVVSPASLHQWHSLGARSMLDARSFMISTLRSQVGFATAVAHARLRLSRLELIGGSGRTAGRYASAARAFIFIN